jgi:sialic acid synthase SpsE
MNLIQLFNNYKHSEHYATPPYVIAEAGVNHEGDINIAKRQIEEAKKGGADAIKFQSYKADTLASKNSPAYWDTSKESILSQHELFKKHDSFWKKEFETLKVYCDKIGIEFLSTPFDEESAYFLNDLMPVYKISSSDITNKPFIELICSFGKPILMSTGGSYYSEIEDAVMWIENSGGNPLALLHCVLNYPTNDENANLAMIQSVKHKYPNKIVGYSDHTLPKDMRTLEIAYLSGAIILEKHFSHDKSLPGNDHYHAMDYQDLILFRKNIKRVLDLMGSNNLNQRQNENLARNNARRSLVAKRKIPTGKIIEMEDLTWKRPAFGIEPGSIDEVIGMSANEEIEFDTILKWSMLK